MSVSVVYFLQEIVNSNFTDIVNLIGNGKKVNSYLLRVYE